MASSSHRYRSLKSKWSAHHKDLQRTLWDKHGDALERFREGTRHVMLGSLAGLLMLSHVNPGHLIAQNLPQMQPSAEQHAQDLSKAMGLLMSELSVTLPGSVEPLSVEQERAVAGILSRRFGLNVSAELEGKRLNRSYGLIGAEQHLMRYPGDTIDTHFDGNDASRFARSGMAPGRGAWGYFAPSREALSQDDVERERWYIAAPTFLAPGFDSNVGEYYRFFKYRKMLVVNPENGKAVVAVIGDAGPAEFTGKHLGGSPEVMDYLERKDGRQKGPVLYYFIDDPDGKVPLGPIQVQPEHETTLL
jgi:hypothetical protein